MCAPAMPCWRSITRPNSGPPAQDCTDASDRRHEDIRRVEIKVGFEITYAAVQPTPMVTMLNIHPSRRADIVGTETIVAEPNVPIWYYRDSFGNICGRLVAPAGGVTLRGSARVRDCGLPEAVVETAQQLPIDQLPDELLLYLMA